MKIKYFFIFALLSILTACSTHNKYIIIKSDPIHLSRTIYIENTFEPYEEDIIINAFKEWENKTHHSFRFKYELHFNSQLTKYLNEKNSLVIRKIKSNYPEVIRLDGFKKKYRKITVGFYTKKNYIPHIFIVEDRIDQNLYFPLLLHEIGHYLNFEHNNNKDSIMYPNVDEGSREITNFDLQEYCDLYVCDWGENK